jgi:hypothetical protein
VIIGASTTSKRATVMPLAGDWMTHVLCVAEEDNTFLGVRPTFAFDKTFSALFSEKLHHGRQDD